MVVDASLWTQLCTETTLWRSLNSRLLLLISVKSTLATTFTPTVMQAETKAPQNYAPTLHRILQVFLQRMSLFLLHPHLSIDTNEPLSRSYIAYNENTWISVVCGSFLFVLLLGVFLLFWLVGFLFVFIWGFLCFCFNLPLIFTLVPFLKIQLLVASSSS